MRRRLVFCVAALATGCSWSRFSDLGENRPVVLLEKPTNFDSGFGANVTPLSIEGKESRVLVGQAIGPFAAAAFDLGLGTDPNTGAIDSSSCDPGQEHDPCYLADHVAGLPLGHVGQGPIERMCYVLGVGKSQLSENPGLIGRCQDFANFTFPVPDSALQKLIQEDVFANHESAPLFLATDKGMVPALAAGARRQKLAWFYRPLSTAAIELLAPGEADDGFGAAVAVLRLEADTGTGEGGGPEKFGRRLVAVGAPDAGHVWLFSGESGRPVGCLGGIDGLGRSLASGHVDGDDVDDLVIGDDTNVTVLSGSALSNLAPAATIDCSFGALPQGAVIASFGCGSRDSTAGCPGGFGAALDVGDLDGDGDGEVIVGSPELTVRGHPKAGAISIYDAEGKEPAYLSDQLFLSSAEDNERLGANLGAAHIDGRDVIVAGAPGGGRAAVFYCSLLVSAGGGPRCE
jgi:FG-GAP repeat